MLLGPVHAERTYVSVAEAPGVYPVDDFETERTKRK